MRPTGRVLNRTLGQLRLDYGAEHTRSGTLWRARPTGRVLTCTLGQLRLDYGAEHT